MLLIAGIVTGAIGTLIGLPALRLSGLYLALITLMAAAAITVLLKMQQFPNGGGGFWGRSRGGGPISQINRPSIALGDTAFYRYCVCVAIVMFLIAFWHVKSKPGRAWAAIRQSEATALSAGVRTTVYKLWAFALAAFFAGVAGGLLASPPGVNINQVTNLQSIQIYALTLVGGVFTLAGAVVGGLVFQLVPALVPAVGHRHRDLHDPVGHRHPPGAPDCSWRHRAAGASRLRQPRQEDVSEPSPGRTGPRRRMRQRPYRHVRRPSWPTVEAVEPTS